MPQRRRAPTDAIEAANQKSDAQFVDDYLTQSIDPDRYPVWTTSWTHPKTDARYELRLQSPQSLGDDDFQACFDLVAETSAADYRSSSVQWRPRAKRKEMRSPELRYVLVKDAAGSVRGFTSLMPTYEEGQPVVYCYEIHLKPELRGTGLGALLMGFHGTVARNLPPVAKVMLTCFAANTRGLAFYRRLGFEVDEISPKTRKLRAGDIPPDYVIMSKRVRRRGEATSTVG
ncbi:hypothetical protein VTK73DRAFT_7429 [Phialemonium thermophilum]|uniref:N-alpha-acetyltransferase 40 n=1 Tax=Phialemonium thermophilum TaxID=223376 RepID=A0ABR3WEM4_9PEZI